MTSNDFRLESSQAAQTRVLTHAEKERYVVDKNNALKKDLRPVNTTNSYTPKQKLFSIGDIALVKFLWWDI
jgi:hypothetical protein